MIQPIEKAGAIWAFEGIVDFLAQGTTPEAVASFEARQRVADLIAKEKGAGLTSGGTAQLNHLVETELGWGVSPVRFRHVLPRGEGQA